MSPQAKAKPPKVPQFKIRDDESANDHCDVSGVVSENDYGGSGGTPDRQPPKIF